MANLDVLNVSKFLDEQRLRPVHWIVLAVSALLVLVDGYDIVCVAYVAPLLRKEWGFPPSSLGLLFGAATFGGALGPILMGRIADKCGRKPVMLVGAIWFGSLTLVSVWADALWQMLILRFLAGIGIGIVVSVLIAYLSEFAPSRVRATIVVVGVVGVALGGGLAGLAAAQLLPHYTWRSMFWVGGCLPIALGIAGFWVMPESPKFLAMRPKRRDELVFLLRRLGAPEALGSTTQLVFIEEPKASRPPLSEVFKGRLGVIVPLLMVSGFFAQFALFVVNQWTTILLTSDGIPVQRAVYATAAFQLAGFIGALAVMRPIDLYGYLPVPVLFALASVSIALMGFPGQTELTLNLLAGVAGFCIIGLGFGNISTTGQIFPTHIRSLGVGICYGVGRLGSVVGPVIAGVLVGLNYSVATLFYLTGSIMLLGVAAGVILVPLYKRQMDEILHAGRPPAVNAHKVKCRFEGKRIT